MEDLAASRRQHRRWIAIAAGVIAFLALSHVVPAILPARKMAKRRTCIANLKHLDDATQSWQVAENRPLDATPSMKNLFGDLTDEMSSTLVCPMGGSYTIGSRVTPPTCSIPGHAITINTNFFKDPRRYSTPAAPRF